MPAPWDDARLEQTEHGATTCTSDDACTVDVLLLIAEVRRQRATLATLRDRLRIRRHQGEPWAVGFARPDWPTIAAILGVTIEEPGAGRGDP